MVYYFEFEEVFHCGEVNKDYDIPNYLQYDGSIHTKDCRVACYNSTTYKTLDTALRDYRRVILESGQRPKPRFFENDEYIPQSIALYNTFVKYGTTEDMKWTLKMKN